MRYTGTGCAVTSLGGLVACLLFLAIQPASWWWLGGGFVCAGFAGVFAHLLEDA